MPPFKITVKERKIQPKIKPEERPKQGEFPRYGGKSTPWSRAEIVAALMWMSDIYQREFDPQDMPREQLAKAFGVSRFTLYRALRDVKRGKDLAVEIGNIAWGENNGDQNPA